MAAPEKRASAAYPAYLRNSFSEAEDEIGGGGGGRGGGGGGGVNVWPDVQRVRRGGNGGLTVVRVRRERRRRSDRSILFRFRRSKT